MRPIKQTLLGLSAIVGLLTVNLAAADAQAQQTGPLCDARTTVLTMLNGKFAEKPNSMGLANNGNVVEVLRSEDGSWTIIVTAPNGVSCLLASGEHWQEVATNANGISQLCRWLPSNNHAISGHTEEF